MPDVANTKTHNRQDQPIAPTAARLGVSIYQLAGDDLFRRNRIDGTGWEWSWADWKRDWMDESPSKFAYRCLPLTIANQTGWHVYNPVGFTATWRGGRGPDGVQFLFDSNPALWMKWINNQFGEGIITWNTPFLFRTKPIGSRLLVCGPANYFKDGIQPLTALIESDWMTMSFTMNWKMTAVNAPIRFEVGEPLFQAIPIATDVCTDLEQADVTYQMLSDDPAVSQAYREWSEGRNKFHEKKRAGEVKPDGWQKDYFQGKDASGRAAAPQHKTKVVPPAIKYPYRKR
jgi:hypothetical protein